jgi:Acyl-CoA reductase (LuxC)
MEKEERVKAFIQLGKFLSAHISGNTIQGMEKFHDELNRITTENFFYNGWFTPKNVEGALEGIAHLLEETELRKFAESVQEPTPRTVAVIMAGNIPGVGFHDLLCVLISGHSLLIKPSSDDHLLIPFFCKILTHYESELAQRIQFAEGKLSHFDAIIATGSNSSALHFEYYFKKYPRIIRKNRNSVAVLNGEESKEDLENLGKDIFSYFGLGCRNVSKLYVPEGYSFDSFFEAMYQYRSVADNKKYFSNYEYHRALFLLEKIDFLDNNFMIVRKASQLSSPVSVIHFETYEDIKKLTAQLKACENEIQCIAGKLQLPQMLPLGKTQSPSINDFADRVNTLDFLKGIG